MQDVVLQEGGEPVVADEEELEGEERPEDG